MVHDASSHQASSGRAIRREATSARIVEAALVVLTEEGVEALTMQRLARELGYAIGAVYRYFPSKEALVLAVQRRVLQRLSEDLAQSDARAIEHLARSKTASPQEAALTRILLAAHTYETLPERRPAHFALLSRWLGDPRPIVAVESAMPIVPGLVDLFASVPALLDEAARAGAIESGDAARRAVALFGAVHGALALRKLERFGIEALEPGAVATELVNSLLRGWGASEPHLTNAMKRARKLASR